MECIRWIEDRPYDDRVPFWTRANVGEVLPEPPSPAGWDLVFDKGGTIAGWRDCAVNRYGIGDDELDADHHRCGFIGCFGGYGYLGATWIRVWAERTPGMSAADIDAAYFGEHPDVPPYVPETWHDNPATTARMAEWLGWVMGGRDQSELEADRRMAHAVRDERPDVASLSDAALVERAAGLRPVYRRLFDQHINQAGAASIGVAVLAGCCAAVGRAGDALGLIAGLGEVDSAAPAQALWELSRAVRSSPAVLARFEGGTTGLDQALRAAGNAETSAFVKSFDRFLAEYGSRGPNEWDLMADTWETRPDLALALVDRLRQLPDDQAPSISAARLGATRRQLTEEIATALSGDGAALAQFKAGLASAAVFVPGRERSKTNIIRVVEESRVALRELGRRLVEGGDLDEAADLCLLFEDELRALGRGELTGLRATVEARRSHHRWLRTLEPPFILNGPPPPNTTWPRRADHLAPAVVVGEFLHGAPGCPGTARGRACVVLDPSDPDQLEPGDILVAPLTDPAWTPLFVPAGGVVVDVGATLSHAIIVSRELGVPCAVSVTDATRRIPHGATIEVDGTTGTVTILALP